MQKYPSLKPHRAPPPADLSNIPAVPVSLFEFNGITEAQDYSDLSIKQFIGDLGLHYKMSEAWGLKAQGTYDFYDDLAAYLFDGTGKALFLFSEYYL